MVRPLVLCSLCFLLFNFLWMRRTLECGGHHRFCHGNCVDSYRFPFAIHQPNRTSCESVSTDPIHPVCLTLPWLNPLIATSTLAAPKAFPDARETPASMKNSSDRKMETWRSKAVVLWQIQDCGGSAESSNFAATSFMRSQSYGKLSSWESVTSAPRWARRLDVQ
jgi:hypothetical protein